MKKLKYDALVIGAGAAGMAAASEIAGNGYSVAVIERETEAGGILNQCIHNGFGLHRFHEELTGPEYAERDIELMKNSGADLFTGMTVTELEAAGRDKQVYAFSSHHGMIVFSVSAVVLAMGCRERNRGNIGTPGRRPAGVFTAGLAQRLVNIDGYIPGNECVIVGSGDIGLIMARRMTWVGAKVRAVVEIQPYPAGLTRNIVQCLNDFSIPLYLSHIVSRINGRDRVEGVDVTPLHNGLEDSSRTFSISCDTLLLSVGLIPDNEVSKTCGIKINPETGGPYVNSQLMTSVDGIFACGNVLHVHDLVDFVSEEAAGCGTYVCSYIEGTKVRDEFPVTAGGNVKYVVPNTYAPERENRFYLRSMIVGNKVTVSASAGGRVLMRKKLRHVQPSEMIQFTLNADDMEGIEAFGDNTLTVGLESGDV
mgnify:CR=1 FL=1